VPELGLGEAETAVVRNAWRRHLALFHNAKRFRFRSLLLQYTLYLLAILTTLGSVLFAIAVRILLNKLYLHVIQIVYTHIDRSVLLQYTLYLLAILTTLGSVLFAIAVSILINI